MTSMHLYRVREATCASLVRDGDAVYDALSTSPPCVELGEGWPALHVMLTAGDPPMPRHVALERGVEWDDQSLENVLMGGEPTPYKDAFTVARVHAPAAVRALAGKLARLSREAFGERFDDDVLEFVPSGWDAAAARAALVTEFVRLVDCYRVAASSGDGLLLHVT